MEPVRSFSPNFLSLLDNSSCDKCASCDLWHNILLPKIALASRKNDLHGKMMTKIALTDVKTKSMYELPLTVMCPTDNKRRLILQQRHLPDRVQLVVSRLHQPASAAAPDHMLGQERQVSGGWTVPGSGFTASGRPVSGVSSGR